MCKDNKNTKYKQLEFKPYYIYEREKKDIEEIIGLIFRDYLENRDIKTK